MRLRSNSTQISEIDHEHEHDRGQVATTVVRKIFPALLTARDARALRVGLHRCLPTQRQMTFSRSVPPTELLFPEVPRSEDKDHLPPAAPIAR